MRLVSERLKQVRKEKGVSRDRLSMDLAGQGFRVTGRTIANWEDGKSVPNANGLMALANYFQKDIRFFFDH